MNTEVYALNKAKGAFNEGRVRQILTKHAIRNKFRVRDIQSAFRRYANSIVLENKHFEGERGLEMIAHQKQRLLEFLKKNRSMKLNIRTERVVWKNLSMMMEEMKLAVRNLYMLYLQHALILVMKMKLTQALEDSVKQILLQIQNLESINL